MQTNETQEISTETNENTVTDTDVILAEQPPEIETRQEKKHVNKSIIEKIQRFQELAEMLEDPENPNEIQELLADITRHGKWVFEYIGLLEKNASELKEKAKKLTEAAKSQENRAKTYKEYLKTALKAGGFDRFTMDDLVLDLIKQTDYIPKAPASEKDLIAMPDYVETILKWKNAPEIMDWVDHKDKVDRVFEWKIDKIKAEIKAAQKILDAKKSTAEQKEIAQNEINKLSELVREEYKYSLKSKVNKLA